MGVPESRLDVIVVFDSLLNTLTSKLMKKTLASLAVAMIALTAQALPSFAQSQPVAGLEILVCNEDGKVVAKTKTTADGSWSFNNLKASADYYLKIEEKAVSNARMAINEKGVPSKKKSTKSNARTASTGDLDGDGDLDFQISFDKSDDVVYRDAASGQASGKRQHHPVTFVKEWGASTPQFFHSTTGKISGKVVWSPRSN